MIASILRRANMNPYEAPQSDQKPKSDRVRKPLSWNMLLLLSIVIAVGLVLLALIFLRGNPIS